MIVEWTTFSLVTFPIWFPTSIWVKKNVSPCLAQTTWNVTTINSLNRMNARVGPFVPEKSILFLLTFSTNQCSYLTWHTVLSMTLTTTGTTGTIHNRGEVAIRRLPGSGYTTLQYYGYACGGGPQSLYHGQGASRHFEGSCYYDPYYTMGMHGVRDHNHHSQLWRSRPSGTLKYPATTILIILWV